VGQVPGGQNTRFRPFAPRAGSEELEFGLGLGTGMPLSSSFHELCGSHYLIGAGTGKGKSRLVATLIMQYCRRLSRTGAPGVVLLDPKSETVDLVLRQIAHEAPTWPKQEQDRLLSSLMVIAPCRRQSAVSPLQLLSAQPHEAEARAAEVSEALTQGVEADMGVLQEVVLGNVLALAIEDREDWSLVEIPHLLSDEALLRQMADRSHLPGPKAYVLSGRLGREGGKRISGIQARIEKLLRIERLRLALAAPGLVDLGDSFRGKITLIDLGSDYGAEEATRIIGRMLFARLVASLFSQPLESLLPTLMVCEEFPDLLGKGLGAKAERLFSQARSRKTGCMVLFQTPAQLQKDGLLRVLQANARITLLGQMPALEAKAFEELLLQTGQVPRPLQPGEILPKALYLTPQEEKSFRLDEIGRLPPATLFFSDRVHRDKTMFITARHFDPPAWSEIQRRVPLELLHRIRNGSHSLPLHEAKRTYERRLERLTELARDRELAEDPAGLLPQRPAAGTGASRRRRRTRGEMP